MTNLPDQDWAYEHSVKLDKKYLISLLQRHDELEMDFLASEYRKHFYITMNHPERIQPQLFGVDKIIEAMRLEPTKITRNPNALLMQLVMRISTNLPMTSRRTSRKKLKLILGGGPLNILGIFRLKA